MSQPILPLLVAPFRAALDLVLPPRCPGCGEIVDGDDRFCATCFADLHFLGAPQCAVCGDPLIHEADAAAQCGACLAERPPYKRARAALAYGGAARTVVLALKHGRRLPLARLMARAMLRAAGPLPDDALIVPVPSHRWRLWQRGFNQAAVIARQMALQSSKPLAVDALERTKPTASTKGMTRQQRRRNAQGAFRVARPDLVRDRVILLVDDVMTTGATVSACAVKLNRAGARHVEVLTFARPLRDVQNISAGMVRQGAKRDGTY
jgi:ComF family protein